MAQENLLEEEELSPDHALTFKQIFGQKMMDFASMSGLIRFVTGLGIAQIIVAVLLIGLNLIDLPSIAVLHTDGTVNFRVSIPVMVACVAFMSTAWSWLMVGALHSRLLIRIPVLVLFFALHIFLLLNQSNTIAGWMILAFALIYAVWHGITRPEGYVRDLLVFGLGVAFCYLAMIDLGQIVMPSGEFSVMLMSLQIGVIGIFLMPLFLFAGLDIGESVRDLSRWFIGQGVSRSNDRMLFWSAIVLIMGKTAVMAALSEFTLAVLLAMAFLLVAGYITVRMRPWEGLHHEPQFLLLFTGAIVVILTMLGFVVLGGASEQENAMFWTLGLTAGVAGLIALSVTRFRPGAGGRTAATYLMLYALWAGVQLLGLAPLWNDTLGLSGNWVVSLDSLDGAAALLLLGLLAYLKRRGLATRSVLAWAISLTTGLSVVRVMFWLVDNNFEVPAMTAAGQLMILAIGLLWDVLTSGDRWTNGDSPNVPRPARVLLYFGYVSMTITAILYFKGTGQSGTYDEDMFAILGLTLMGIPLYLFGFARAGVLLVRQAWQRGTETP